MSNIPMTNPDGLLALHEENYGHSSSYVELENGDILHGVSCGRRISTDGGLTWSELFRHQTTEGDWVVSIGLVQLGGSGIGCASQGWYDQNDKAHDREQIFFWRSEDNGKTWHPKIPVHPPGLIGHHMLQDVVLRTSSGRIIIPAYASLGQKVVAGPQADSLRGSYYTDSDLPFPGALYNNQWVSVDAHFTDPGFGGCTLFYSDDDGQTWAQTESGYLLINHEFGGPHATTAEPTVTEVAPGHLLMFMRTGLGRLFQAWSYDDGSTWTRPQPTQLAADHSPAQLRTIPGTNHLLCVWTQHSEEETRRGLVRVRLSSAISRTGGSVWELYRNVESILEETRVAPGPIHNVRPEDMFHVPGRAAATTADPAYIEALPEGYGRWSYPSVFVYHDRVLIAHTYSKYDRQARSQGGSRLKVLPLKWFYGDADPEADNPNIKNAFRPATP